jgi:hypothetical protein
MGTASIRPTPAADETIGWIDQLKAIAVGLVVALLVFLSVVGWLTLQNTYAVVHGHNAELVQLKTDVQVVDGYGAGFEWQNGMICSALHIDCTISPPGPPPPHRTR